MDVPIKEVLEQVALFKFPISVAVLLVITPLLAWAYFLRTPKAVDYLYKLVKDKVSPENFTQLLNRLLLVIVLFGILATAVAVIYTVLNRPIVQSKTVELVITQGNGLYNGRCTIDWRIPPHGEKSVIEGGRFAVPDMPINASTISIFSIEAFGENITPSGKTDPPPWEYAIDSKGMVKIDLGKKPEKAVCKPPTVDELKAQLANNGKLDAIKANVENARSDKARDAVRKLATLTFSNATSQKINLIGMDCKKLFEASDGLDLEDSDWMDFLSFPGKASVEQLHFNRFKEMNDTTGWYCLFACVSTGNTDTPVYLGTFDLLASETSEYKLVLGGSKDKPIVLLPDEKDSP